LKRLDTTSLIVYYSKTAYGMNPAIQCFHLNWTIFILRNK